MSNFKELAVEILNAVGGKENVTNVTHCMTRLRFNLNDMEKVDEEVLKALKGVLGVAKSGGQYQVIIGQTVPKLYAEVCDLVGVVAGKEVPEVKEKFTLKKLGNDILDYLAGSFTPIIPVLIGAAMVKTILAVCGPSLLGWIPEGSDLYTLFTFVGDAGFYFLPVIVGYTAAKKMGLTPVMGMFMGAILIHPTLVQMATDGVAFTVYGIPTTVSNYSSSTIPILLSVWAMAKVEKLLNKFMPAALKTIFTPTLTILIMLPISLCLLAPIGGYVGQLISTGLLAFGDFGGFIAIAVIAALWEFLVISGMHIVMVVTMMTMIMTTGSEAMIAPAATCATFAAMGMALGAALKLKDKEEKSLGIGYFISGILGGVTEPALYGVGFKYKKPFIGMMIGAALGGIYAGLMNVSVYVIGATNFLAVLTYAGGGTANIIHGTISCVLSLVGAAVATYVIGLKEK